MFFSSTKKKNLFFKKKRIFFFNLFIKIYSLRFFIVVVNPFIFQMFNAEGGMGRGLLLKKGGDDVNK